MSKKRKPSFESPDDAGVPAGWVYRSDGETPAVTPPSPARSRRASAAAGGAKPSAAGSPAPSVTEPARPATDRPAVAQAIVDRYAKYAATAGLVPVPMVDVAAIAAVQLSMLKSLAAHHGVAFSRERGKGIIAALIGGLMPSLAGHQILKIAGPIFGMVSISGFAASATYAIGRLFITHFEGGGTLGDLDIARSRQQLAAQLSRP